MLNKFPSVAILGARQIGKTTLAFKIKEIFARPSLYLDLERPSDLSKLSDPEFFFKQHFDKLLILDEIQRAPHLLPILRSMIDERRRASDIAAQYLLLGSSSKMLLNQSSESLAGRIAYTELPGLNLLEVGDKHFNKLWVRGGFPQSYLDDDIYDSLLWRENLIKTYLEREIQLLGFNIDTQIMRRFWGMLAHNQGELFNGAKIASSLGVSTPTVFKYLSILQDLFIVRILQPWHQNIGKRLVKSPKIYIRDSGLLHSLLGIKTLDDLLMHPVAGNSFEGFVIENIKSIMQPYQNMWF
ncbi:MAG: ATP-binding protein, partial [Alphaproteobacteria bacterium]|nr:ATP-binding protein [Alphaproteobacteria bacterium]